MVAGGGWRAGVGGVRAVDRVAVDPAA
jgi:hypothetical protein